MAGLLSRFTNFLPNTTILSNDHNQELNRIVNLLNGTTTNLKTVLKTSDAGDPPLELDQLSTGPILKGFQGGVLKFQFSNAGNLLFNQSGGFIGDQNANEYLKFATVASAVNEIEISNAAASGRPKIATTGGDTNIGLDISPKGTGQVFITGSSPVRLPAVDPSDNSDATRKIYVDGKKTAFSIVFFIADPTTPTVDAAISGVPAFIVPEGLNITFTKILALFRTGSHTGGGDVTFSIFKRAANGGGGATIASIDLDDTNNTAFVVYEADINPDVVANQKDTLDCFIDARSGTVTERDVCIALIGTQTLTG